MKKICKRCFEEKEVEEFSIDNSRSDGRHVYCKECRRSHEYLRNRDKKLKKQKDYYHNNKGKILDQQRDKRYSLDVFKQKMFEVHGDIISVVNETYINTQVRCDFIDKDYGAFSAYPYHLLSGDIGHPTRRQKAKEETWMKNLGVRNPAQSPAVKEKMRKTMVDRYGVENPAQSEELKEKARNTNLERYGAENPMQNVEVRLRSARSANSITEMNHWKTNEIVYCQGGYEVKVVDYLNKNKIDYKSQPDPFFMPDGRSYTLDFYLPEENKYIEVKGYFYDDALEKWEWFHETHPNSELWNEKKLKELGIL